jgi:hypothetical protein
MATSLNTFRLRTILKEFLAFFDRHPQAVGSATHRSTVEQALAMHSETIAATDEAYLHWRRAFHHVTVTHQRLRAECDRVRERCQEWGVPDYPRRLVPYQEEETLREATWDWLTFLEGVSLRADWVGQEQSSLENKLDEARAAWAEQELALAAYQKRVKARKVAMAHCQNLVLDIFEQVGPTLDPHGEEIVRLDPGTF